MSLIDGRPSTLLARLTAAKSAFLDAAISSRAAASTALSTATWTSARASNLDNLDAAISTVGSTPPIASGLVGRPVSNADLQAFDNVTKQFPVELGSASVSSNVWTNIYQISSNDGYFELLGVMQSANASNRDCSIRLVVSNTSPETVVYESDSNLFQTSSDNNKGVWLVGFHDSGLSDPLAAAMGRLYFKTRIAVQAKMNEGGGGSATFKVYGYGTKTA